MTFRKLLFWIHLVVGLSFGAVILLLCVSGALLALEKEWVGLADHLASPTHGDGSKAALPLKELATRASSMRDGAQPSSITLYADPRRPWSVSFGRSDVIWLDPRTGELAGQGSRRTRDWMRRLTEWHRWLGREGDAREVGKAITGAANVMFLFLALSGLVLWAPRRWSLESVKAALRLRWNVRGRARDWNWHTVAGFWIAPILIVLTVSGLVLSYRWAGDWVYRVAGSTPPSPGAGPGGNNGPAVTIPKTEEGAASLSWDALLAKVQAEAPDWEQITIRRPGPARRGERDSAPSAGDSRQRGRDGSQAISVSLRTAGSPPQSGSQQLTLDPFSGAVLKRERYADYDAGRRLRLWLRFLHTGEALGTPGRYLAAAGCVVGALLVWTGFTLAWFRFLGRRPGAGTEAEVR